MAQAAPVLDADARDVENGLQSVAYNPQPERHVGILVAAENQDGGGGGDEGAVPENVQDDDGLGIGPIALPLLELLRRRLPHHHGRLTHEAAAAGLAQEARGLAEAGAAEEEAAGGGFVGGSGEERRGIGGGILGGTVRGPCCRRGHV